MKSGEEENQQIIDKATEIEEMVHEQIVKFLKKGAKKEARIARASSVIAILFMLSYGRLMDAFIKMSIDAGRKTEEIKMDISSAVDDNLGNIRHELVRASHATLDSLINNKKQHKKH